MTGAGGWGSPAGAWASSRPGGGPGGIRLFCFPHAGGGTAAFATWRSLLPADVDLWPVRLPGRESRIRERPLTSMPELSKAAYEGLAPLFGSRFAFFGHSLGALLAFEVARISRRVEGRLPCCLVVSGCGAPHLPSGLPPIAGAPEGELIAQLRLLNGLPAELLAEPELLQLLLPVMRADLAVLESYRHLPEPPLGCPVLAFGGRDDPLVSEVDLKGWERHSSAGGPTRLLDGDHFFVQSSAAALVSEMVPWLRRSCGAGG